MKINIIGSYPPPIGGVSTHVERLSTQLEGSEHEIVLFDDYLLPNLVFLVKLRNFIFGIKNPDRKVVTKNYNIKNAQQLLDFSTLFFYLVFKNRKIKNIVHFHSKFWKYSALLVITKLLNRKNKIIFTIHSMREEYHSMSLLQKIYLKIAIHGSDYFLVTNNIIKEKLLNYGADPHSVEVVIPFIPPPHKQNDFDSIPKGVWNFADKKGPILVSNAFRISFYNGEDLYGIDMCVELINKLRNDFPSIGLIFSIPDVNDIQYFNKMQNLVKQYDLDESIYFLTRPLPFYPLLTKSDLFLRATNTDGDAISIREALHLKIPVVASDCVTRPREVNLFKTREFDDFYKVTLNVLKNISFEKEKLISSRLTSGLDQIIEIYKKILQ